MLQNNGAVELLVEDFFKDGTALDSDTFEELVTDVSSTAFR